MWYSVKVISMNISLAGGLTGKIADSLSDITNHKRMEILRICIVLQFK